ncbi:required for excision 1-B domain-containing protein-like isoform X1 [Haliotis rubra]|uniref:required for excision 1-B domain-containing protein-like isoform X1 n=1 Tax=Haliotis rubra TaxID=36100 RepID=UPI001EE4F0F7|nr:required for excision 1-B domain-containing protein-like isoform X1 [Haliotis rubra]
MEVDNSTAVDESTTTSPRLLLKRFYDLQAERVQTYLLFDEGFQAYLKGAPNYNFSMYRQLVHEITETFQKISQDVIKVKDSLANVCNLNQIANILDQVQDEERNKLELTARLQIAQQNAVDHPADECYKAEIVELKQKVGERIQNINEFLEELKYESENLYTDEEEER